MSMHNKMMSISRLSSLDLMANINAMSLKKLSKNNTFTVSASTKVDKYKMKKSREGQEESTAFFDRIVKHEQKMEEYELQK